MKNLTDSKAIRFKYGLKRFVLCGLYGIICSFFPFFVFGAMFGLPSVLLAASVLAIADAINLKIDLDEKVPIVFTRVHKKALLILLLIIILYTIVLGVTKNYS